MLELTLVRHASTLLNEQRRYQGHCDPPLSARGRAEALRLGERLRGATFRRVLCSDLRRCRETVALALPGVDPETDPRLREIHFGRWDGRTWDECHARDPEPLRAWTDDPEHHAPPGGEAFHDFRLRVDEALDALPLEGNALLVGHGGPIRRIVARALGLSWRQTACMELLACGITRIALHPEGAHLRCWNDTAHLEQNDP